MFTLDANGIHGANSCKQGYAPSHTLNPLHGLILQAGYGYSHSTPVICHNAVGESFVSVHHTYKRATHNVGVWLASTGRWNWDTSTSCGSGRSWRGNSLEGLRKHLASKRRRYVTLRG